MLEQGRAAVRALVVARRDIPGREVALRIVGAAVEDVTSSRLALDDVAAALRAAGAGLLDEGLRVLALGVTRAGKELAVTAGLDDHHAAALLTGDVGLVGLELDLDALHVGLRLLEGAFEVVVEFAEDLDVVLAAFGDLVEVGLHAGGELRVDDLRELLLEEFRDLLAEFGRLQALRLADDVLTVQDGRDDGGVGGRTADAVLLQSLDEGRLGVAGRRLGEVLVAEQLAEFQDVAHGQVREHGAGLLVVDVVDGGEAVELDAVAGSGEHAVLIRVAVRVGRFDLHFHRVLDGGRHHGGDEPLPDETVQFILVGAEGAADFVRSERDVRRADGLMAVLRVVALLEVTGLVRDILVAVGGLDVVHRRSTGLVGDTERVRSHVGDETDLGALDVDTFVQLLGHLHGATGLEAEAAGRVLLQGGGDERRRRLFAAGALLHGVHDIDRVLEPAEVLVGGLFVLDLDFALFIGGEGSREDAAGAGRAELRVDAPVLFRFEVPDLLLPVHDEAQGHGLDPAGGETAADLLGDEGRDTVTDETVQDAARLLRVDEVLVDGPRVLHARFDATLRDLVERDTVLFLHVQTHDRGEVPCDGFPFAVGVGREVDVVVLLCIVLQFLDQFLLALDDRVLRFKVVFDVDVESRRRQVAHVAHAGRDIVVRSEDGLDGADLGRGLDNDEIRHAVTPVLRDFL